MNEKRTVFVINIETQISQEINQQIREINNLRENGYFISVPFIGGNSYIKSIDNDRLRIVSINIIKYSIILEMEDNKNDIIIHIEDEKLHIEIEQE